MRSRYQAVFFADLARMTPSTELTVSLMNQLNARGIGLMPNIVQEPSPLGLPPVPRIRFSSPNGANEIIIGSSRIDIFRHLQPGGISLHDGSEIFSNFVDYADRVITALLDGLEVRGNRLALVVNSIF